MDHNKAKKAKTKAKSHNTQKRISLEQIAQQQAATAQMMAMSQQQGQGFINPEVQAQQISLQPPTTNPYHMMGAMAPTSYRYGNMVDGYDGIDPQFRPMG